MTKGSTYRRDDLRRATMMEAMIFDAMCYDGCDDDDDGRWCVVELMMLCGSRAARSAGGRCVSAAACMSMCRVRGCDVGC